MTTLELTLNLPDELASKAQAAGLLDLEANEKLLREQPRRQAGLELRAMMDKLSADSAPPMTEDEVQAEIEACPRRASGQARHDLVRVVLGTNIVVSGFYLGERASRHYRRGHREADHALHLCRTDRGARRRPAWAEIRQAPG